MSNADPALGELVASSGAIAQAVGQVPVLRIIDRGGEPDLETAKAWLLAPPSGERPLAVIVVHADAIVRAAGRREYGTYDLYAPRALDDATESAIHDGLRQAIVNGRLRESGLDRAALEATMRVTRPRAVTVAAGGEQQTGRDFNRMLPFLLGMLMFVGVIVSGQTLMTSTIEEKSSRVVEVLLAAVSPFELMAGKLLGQLAVGLIVLLLYVGVGLVALLSFAMLGLLDPVLILYLVGFFLITYLVFGALMIAIGAAVTQIADAQSLMGPVMMLLVAPYLLAPMVMRSPNSTMAVVASFIPPTNAFVMMTRLASPTPPPAWHVLIAMALGLVAALGALWFAAKVFKVGLLMHGKPPNFATLIRWAREA
jgi:ABC-type Na+ efflux pump permease subunit